jgi:transcriptional regulator with XRE-family HTH domain
MVSAKRKNQAFSMPEINTGDWAKNVRLSRKISQSELARRCGVSSHEVSLFEKNQPVKLQVKLRLLHELWANRSYQ